MTDKKWYEVPADQEQAIIRQKRKEWFPNADEKDWAILKSIYSKVDLRKRNYRPLLKDVIHLFNPATAKEVKNFCSKFSSRIISFPEDMQRVQINDIAYSVLFKETFQDIRETAYWIPYLERILVANQTDGNDSKTDFQERELIDLLSDFKSQELLEEQRKHRGEIIVQTIRTPNLGSFILSGIAYYYSPSDTSNLIGLQRGQILGHDSKEWYDNFFRQHFDVFEAPKESTPQIVQPPETKRTKTKEKIFISCGQYHKHERDLGAKLVELVNELTPHTGYFAQNQTSLNGLSENIFKELNNCIGLVVVMHGRGSITTPDGKTVTRASVWIEQEIAIASFIHTIQKKEINVILFAENGISIEGVRSQIQLNPIVFDKNEDVEKQFQEMLLAGKFGLTKK